MLLSLSELFFLFTSVVVLIKNLRHRTVYANFDLLRNVEPCVKEILKNFVVIKT